MAAPPDNDPKTEENETELATEENFHRAKKIAEESGALRGMSTEQKNLNVRDALAFLDAVKSTFADVPETYNSFLDIMKDFKTQVLDTPGVIDRVSSLFRNHAKLIEGFNTFLPAGYRIQLQPPSEAFPEGSIIVETPQETVQLKPGEGTYMQALEKQREAKRAQATMTAPPPVGGPSETKSNEPLAQPSGHGDAPLPSNSAPSPQPPQASTAPDSTAARQEETQRSTETDKTSTAPQQQPATPQDEGLVPLPQPTPAIRAMPEFNHAVDFVNRIKARFKDGSTYTKFLNILQLYQMERKSIQQVHEEVTDLFRDAPDLLNDFKTFLPEKMDNQSGVLLGGAANSQAIPPVPPAPASSRTPSYASQQPQSQQRQRQDPVSNKRKRDAETSKTVTTPSSQGAPSARPATKRPTENAPENGSAQAAVENPALQYSSMRMNGADNAPADPYYAQVPPAAPPLLPPHPGRTIATHEEVMFFEKVSKYIEERTTYHEFLKSINLFTQEIIDLPTLVSRAQVFLGNAPELFMEFKNMVGWKDEVQYKAGKVDGGKLVIDNVPMGSLLSVRPDLKHADTSGPSYRRLPDSARQAQCSGRDALCWEVLNDSWVSQPTSVSEDGFIPTRKNEFEAAMHQTEEERYDYDYYIEANLRTISLLDPIITRISQMAPSEREAFCLKPGLGGQSKSIYQGVIKKIYGHEHGQTVITALHDNPCVAAPIVMNRLKHKDEEWKRALREWSRVWRDADRKNYYKALDYRGIEIKTTDKRAVTSKGLVSEIEVLRREQHIQRLARARGSFLPKPAVSQLTYTVSDDAVWFDVLRLVISFLDRTRTFDPDERDRIETAIRPFMALVFGIPKDTVDAYLTPTEVPPPTEAGSDGGSEAEASQTEEHSAPPPARRGGKKSKKEIADLRRRTLQRTAANRGRRGRGGAAVSAASSREGTPDNDISDFGTPEPSISAGSPAPGAATDMELDAKEPVPATAGGLQGMDGVETISTAAADGDVSDVSTPADSTPLASGPQLDAEAVDAPFPSTSSAKQSDTPASAIPTVIAPPSPAAPGFKDLSWSRKYYNFFCGTPHYCLLRLFQIIVFRLQKMKQAAEGVALRGQGANWSLSEEELLVLRAQPKTTQAAQQLYSRLLGALEQHWDTPNHTEAHLEDDIRKMFGVQGFWFYTIDRLMTALCKFALATTKDSRHADIGDLLRRERQMPTPTEIQLLTYRRNAETLLGAEENIFRICWEPRRSGLSFQLLGKDELPAQDEFAAQDHWEVYMTAYMSTDETPGIERNLMRMPYLKRHLDLSLSLGDRSQIRAKSGLQIRFCLRTLRKFFVKGGEDWFVRRPRQMQKLKTAQSWQNKFSSWHQKRFQDLPEPAPASTSAKTSQEQKEADVSDAEALKQASVAEAASEPTDVTVGKMEIDEPAIPSVTGTSTPLFPAIPSVTGSSAPIPPAVGSVNSAASTAETRPEDPSIATTASTSPTAPVSAPADSSLETASRMTAAPQ